MNWKTLNRGDITATLKGGVDEGDLYTSTICLSRVKVDENGVPTAEWSWNIVYRTHIDGKINRIGITNGSSDTLHGAYNDMLQGAIKCRVITLQEYEEITGLRSAS